MFLNRNGVILMQKKKKFKSGIAVLVYAVLNLSFAYSLLLYQMCVDEWIFRQKLFFFNFKVNERNY